MISDLGMDDFAQDMNGLGRNEMPERLLLAWVSGEIGVALLREWILPTWELAEWPVATLGHQRWLDMFAATGFVTDGCDDPPTPLTVYRGAARRYARGFSWTWEQERAEWFAQRTALFGIPAAVYEVTLPRELLLGVIGGVESRGEHEVLVNPRRLRGRWTPREILDVPASRASSSR